jgi:segregation and condensation protein A
MSQSVVVHVDKFSGPMDLLLHLIRQEEMNIFDINIHDITRQYLDSIKAMKKLNLEVAGDFVAMASTLIQIKSKMLLPQYNEEGEVVEQEDPRKDLVRRLMEYQMYQDASKSLNSRDLLGRNVFARGLREDLAEVDDEIIMEEENALFSLISAYRMAVKNIKKTVHRVGESLESISDRIWAMRDKLVIGRATRFFEFFQGGPDQRGNILITFLSLLELAKIGVVSLFQSENFADIHIDTKKPIDQNMLSKVENYDTQAQSKELVLDVWLNEEERAQEPELPLMAAAAQVGQESEIAVEESATDEEIEAEEKRYEQEKISKFAESGFADGSDSSGGNSGDISGRDDAGGDAGVGPDRGFGQPDL